MARKETKTKKVKLAIKRPKIEVESFTKSDALELKQVEIVESTDSPKTAVYSLVLRVNDKEYTAEGETLEEALNNIKIEPTRGVLKIYTKGILKVKKGEKEIERLLFIPQMTRAFSGRKGLTKESAIISIIKYFEMMLK